MQELEIFLANELLRYISVQIMDVRTLKDLNGERS